MHFLPELYMHHVPALCLQSSENPEEGMGPPETGVGTVVSCCVDARASARAPSALNC